MVGSPIQPLQAKSATTRESALVALLWEVEGYRTHRRGESRRAFAFFFRGNIHVYQNEKADAEM